MVISDAQTPLIKPFSSNWPYNFTMSVYFTSDCFYISQIKTLFQLAKYKTISRLKMLTICEEN